MIQSLRILASAMMGSILVIGLAMFFVLGDPSMAPFRPEPWAVAVVLAEAALVNVAILLVGYQAPAVPPGRPRGEGYVAAFRASMMVRMVLAESTAIVALALGFVVSQGGFLTFLVGAAIALVAMGVHGYPWSFPIERYRARLERDGGTSYLREDLGLAPRTGGGVIQEL